MEKWANYKAAYQIKIGGQLSHSFLLDFDGKPQTNNRKRRKQQLILSNNNRQKNINFDSSKIKWTQPEKELFIRHTD